MGTSSARRAPSTPWWRLAKGAATRYLAPEGGGAVAAGEVVARYLTALGEGTGQGSETGLAAFRFTRRVAQDLGAFGSQASSRGLETALEAWGWGEPAGRTWVVAAPGLAALLAGSGAGLEEAVVRSALAAVLTAHQPGDRGSCPDEPASGTLPPDGLVRKFLATALYVRLALDLGESLEAAAGGGGRFNAGLAEIRDLIAGAAGASGVRPAPISPEQWRGLPGWSWVTKVMERLIKELSLGAQQK